MKIIGKVLWYDSKYQKGVIVDGQGNEFYFDVSVVEGRKESGLRPSKIVAFEINSSIKHVMVAKWVSIPAQKNRASLEREFINTTRDAAA